MHIDGLIKLSNIKELNLYFQENILVVDEKTKASILVKSFKQKQIITFKLLTIKQLEQMILPSLPSKAKYIIYKDINNYNLATQIFNSLKYRYYNQDIDIANEKVGLLDKYINILEKENYLIENSFINSKIIYSLNLNLDYLNVKYIDVVEKKIEITTEIKVEEFSDIEEEIMFTFGEIAQLLVNNYNIDDINVYMPKSYKNFFKVFSNYYSIPIEIDSAYKIVSNKQVNKFIENIRKASLSKALVSINETIVNNDIKNKIIQLANTYIEYIDEKEFINYFINELSNIKINNIIEKNVLKVKSIEDFDFSKTGFNFILGCNNIDFIKYKMDDDFLNDELKDRLKVRTSIEANKIKEQDISNILGYISENTNYRLSYAKSIGKKLYLHSQMIPKDKLHLKHTLITNNNRRFSSSVDTYLYKKELNKKNNYNIITDNFRNLEQNITQQQKKDLAFELLNFKKWKKEEFKEKKNISSTLVEKYYKCNFVFYIENILGLKHFPKNTLSLHIGTYIHQILDDVINERMEDNLTEEQLINLIKLSSNEYLANDSRIFKQLDNGKKDYIINKINNYLLMLIKIIVEQINQEKFKIFKTEEEVNLNYQGYNFTGKIDKVLKDDNDNFMVIDYKSGDPDLDLSDNLLENGINLQNLIYFILLKSKYKDLKFAGTYRYKVLPKISKDDVKTIYKRHGYTNDKPDVISKIDIENYQNLGLKKNGEFTVHSKVINDKEFASKITIVKETIDNFIENIEKSTNFAAIPLVYKEKSACKYCPYINICYKGKKTKKI